MRNYYLQLQSHRQVMKLKHNLKEFVISRRGFFFIHLHLLTSLSLIVSYCFSKKIACTTFFRTLNVENQRVPIPILWRHFWTAEHVFFPDLQAIFHRREVVGRFDRKSGKTFAKRIWRTKWGRSNDHRKNPHSCQKHFAGSIIQMSHVCVTCSSMTGVFLRYSIHWGLVIGTKWPVKVSLLGRFAHNKRPEHGPITSTTRYWSDIGGSITRPWCSFILSNVTLVAVVMQWSYKACDIL